MRNRTRHGWPRSQRAWRRLGLVLLVLSRPAATSAQVAPSPEELARGEAAFWRYLEFPSLVRGGTITPHWVSDTTDVFWFVEGVDQGDVRIARVDLRANQVVPVFDVTRLRAAVAEELGYEPPGRGVPFSAFTSGADGRIRFEVSGRRFALDTTTYVLDRLPSSSDLDGWAAWRTPREVKRSPWVGGPPMMEIPSPDGRWLLSERDGDLWLRSTYDGKSHRLTDDATDRVGWDFGGLAWSAGIRWSPDARRIAALKADLRGLTLSPVVHWLGPKELVDWWYYPDPGDPLPRTELYVLDARGRDRVRIDVGDDPDDSFRFLFWRGNDELVMVREDRRRKTLELLGVDAATGATRVILTETQPTFVEFKGIAPLPDDRFLWISERDGWAHLYLYGMDGTLVRRLTAGRFPVASVVRVDVEGGWVYFTAHGELERDRELGAPRVYDTHMYRVPLAGGAIRRLTEGTGQHEIQFAPSGRFFLDTHSSVSRPPRTEARTADGRLLRTLSIADVGAVEALGWTPPEEFVVKAADGVTDLYGVLFKPADFDPARRYPVIDHLYGGPQATWAPRNFVQEPQGVVAQALAQMGFIVFTVDGRGTPERGKAFQDVVYGRLGRNEIPDHVAALDQLSASRPYMDRSRVGLFGSSWGGYFTLRGLLLRPDVYHAGVAGAPVGDATVFLGHEIYLGLPAENPEGYAYASNTAIADRLAGHLLIPIGTADQNVKFAFAMQIAEALIRKGKFFDMIVLPGRDHHYGYDQRGRTWQERTYFVEAIRRHFVKYLLLRGSLPPTSATVARAYQGPPRSPD